MRVNPVDLLVRYLRDQKMSQADLARAAGITEAQVSRILSKKRRPGIDAAHAIEQATEGKVPASAWAVPRFPKAA